MTCQSYLSYVHFRGVTKWPTHACTISNQDGVPEGTTLQVAHDGHL